MLVQPKKRRFKKEDEKAIRNLHDVFEDRFTHADLASTMIEFYAEDSVQIPPNETVVAGRESIQARFESFKGNLTWERRERPIKII